MEKLQKIFPAILVVTVELFSVIVLFFIAPVLSYVAADWVWISFAVINLIAVYFFALYFLRKERPVIWLIGVPVNIISVIVLSLIKSERIAYALELYGIYSVHYDEFVYTSNYYAYIVPFYVDAIVFATLIFLFRTMFSIPTYYVYHS